MNKLKNAKEFLVTPDLAPEYLPEEMSRLGYRVTEERPSISKSRLFDTFDWRLLGSGLLLARGRDGYQLYGADDGREFGRAPGKGGGHKFSHDFPAGPLREALTPVIAMRALLPLLDLRARSRCWEIRNRDDKLVLRCRWRQLEVRRVAWRSDPHPRPAKGGAAPEPLHTLVLEPVTGYRKPEREALATLEPLNLSPVSRLAAHLYRHVGFDLEAGKKTVPQLGPDWPAAKAALEILRHQYRVMRLNEAGIIADLDSEFLHDFRVALRRSRAAMSRIKKVLPASAKHFRSQLADLARRSNRLRDLDVYLLQREEYRQMLPACLQEGLEPIFSVLAEERGREFKKLARWMKGAEYRRIMAKWGQFLASYEPWQAEDGVAVPANALAPVLPLAEEAIAAACLRLLEHGRAIGPDSPDEALHALRLDCKKLRYLFEFFATLFPSEEITPLINRTKKLQDNLGAFNDFFVQQEALRHFLAALGRGGTKHAAGLAAAAAAIGGLITRLSREQGRVRRDFAKTFKAFEGCGNRKKFCPEE
ncbi:MAG TPA: CHAD domain-containing protein [Desulfurivibrio alkaliphilus]|uniref:CHAD domain-containing protein n=1 Tax=Desulfurivibrio alkaliphilus TaxID=427923 RepID=A0A7C2Y0J3_9BACT|nr:CHAD domain-containing protein [Desulfurivibrio alkaliphilus]